MYKIQKKMASNATIWRRTISMHVAVPCSPRERVVPGCMILCVSEPPVTRVPCHWVFGIWNMHVRIAIKRMRNFLGVVYTCVYNSLE